MKIAEPDPSTIREAIEGSLPAVDALISTVQPGVYKLAVHMLGHRDDAPDATQEILLKVVTHLSGFRAESAFSTWVWRVANNCLMTARSRPESQRAAILAVLRQEGRMQRGQLQ